MAMMHRCTQILAAALVWLVPFVIHAQAADKAPLEKPSGVPKIVFESLAHDFGTVQPNAALTHNFAFKNTGTAPLLIEKVKAG